MQTCEGVFAHYYFRGQRVIKCTNKIRYKGT